MIDYRVIQIDHSSFENWAPLIAYDNLLPEAFNLVSTGSCSFNNYSSNIYEKQKEHAMT